MKVIRHGPLGVFFWGLRRGTNEIGPVSPGKWKINDWRGQRRHPPGSHPREKDWRGVMVFVGGGRGGPRAGQ